MPPERAQRPRQEPVSCESCRKKKLKCNREQPCSNCVARGVTCDFQGRKVPTVLYSSISPEDEVAALRAENVAIRTRIDRLEEITYNGNYNKTGERPTKARRLVEREGDVGLPSPSTGLSISPESELSKTHKDDLQWLEGVGTQENTRLPQLSTPFSIRIVQLQHIVQQASFEGQHERCILLPDADLGLQLFERYAEQLEPLQHLLHIPTARRSIKLLYEHLKMGERVEANQTVLLLTVMTSIASYWGLSDCSSSIFGAMQTTINVAVMWLRTALDVLEHVRRSAPASLETVQASIITIFLIYHIEGFSPKIRAIVYATLAVAKDLGLHRTDDPSYLRQQEVQMDIVETEVRRRVWWHLASTDWLVYISTLLHSMC